MRDDFRESEHAKVIVVHSLIVSDVDAALDDVNFVVLELLDDTDDLSEEPIIVAFLICKVPPILRVPNDSKGMVGCELLSDLHMSACMFFLRFLC